jgi:murein L,D-transpeptidase YafK
MRIVSKRKPNARPVALLAACLVGVGLTCVIAFGSPFIPYEYVVPQMLADSLVVIKSERALQVFIGGQVERVYCIGLGVNAEGPKRQRGDRRTPEGLYTIDWRNGNSGFYKALHISYPNESDKALARKRRVHPGNNIVIHGRPNEAAHLISFDWATNWTDGCIAVDNSHMDELWDIVPDHCPIRILP